jgi:hypothetical protein
MDIIGKISCINGPIYEFMTNGQQVSVAAFADGLWQSNAILNSTNLSATLYTGDDFTAEASLSVNNDTNIYTLTYTVTFMSQNGTTTITGTLVSWLYQPQ